MAIRRIKIEAIGAGIVIFAAVAIILHIHQLLYMLSTLILLPLIAQLIGRLSVIGIKARRYAPGEAHANGAFDVRLNIRSTGWFRKFMVEVEDELSPWLEAEGASGAVIPGLMAGEPAEISYQVRPIKRGVHRIGPLRVRVSDPLGLWEYWRQIQEADEIVVYPSPFPLPEFRFAVNKPFGHMFRRKLRPEPDGMDFHRLREYVPGDDLRRIHWRTTARRGKLTVIDYEDMEVVDVSIALDLSRGSDIGSGIHTAEEYAVNIAASVAKRALQLQGSVRMLAVGAENYSLPERTGPGAFQPILEALARVRSGGSGRFASPLQSWAVAARPGTALVIIGPAVEPALVDIVQHLVAARVYVTVVCLDVNSFADYAIGRRQRLSASQRALLQEARNAGDRVDKLIAAGAVVYPVGCMDDLQSRLVAPSVMVA